MFQLYDAGAFDLMMKSNIKKWEYVLYNGVRPEFYPQDKKAIFSLVQFKQERIKKERKKAEKEERLQSMRNNKVGMG